MTKKEIIKEVKSHPGNKIKFAVTDIDGVLRGKILSKNKFLNIVEEGTGFCNVVFGWDINDKVYENAQVTGWHTGYPDAIATIDPNSFRAIPWDNEMPFYLADFEADDSDLAKVCPRSLLKRIQNECREMGYHAEFAAEYEWFNFAETPGSLQDKEYQNLQPLNPGMFGYSVLRTSLNSSYINDLYNHLSSFDVPVEGLHTETGDGIYEASIAHTNVLEAADRAVLFKTGVKEIAYRNEVIASFMAKWSNKLPGCGGHVHQSIWDEEEGKNLFFDTEKENNMSSLMQQYLAGQLKCLPYILPMYAPTVNSYKRFVSGSWASTTVSWGHENRTTALRTITQGKGAARLETRVPGADANPYLAMAASLASGLYGIKNELTLDISPTKGNEYENKDSLTLPSTLQDATKAMKSSSIPEELFGERFVDHFTRTREWEWKEFSKRVTDWEVERYLELI